MKSSCERRRAPQGDYWSLGEATPRIVVTSEESLSHEAVGHVPHRVAHATRVLCPLAPGP